jgi:hypothetical protein
MRSSLRAAIPRLAAAEDRSGRAPSYSTWSSIRWSIRARIRSGVRARSSTSSVRRAVRRCSRSSRTGRSSTTTIG